MEQNSVNTQSALEARLARLEQTVEEQADQISQLTERLVEVEVTSRGSGFGIESDLAEYEY